MTIAIDFYDTITTNPELYVKSLLSYSYMDKNTVYVLSAVKEKNVTNLVTEATTQFIPPHMLYPVIFENYEDVPRLKYEIAKELGVDLLIDDRLDTCQYFMERGILAVQPVNLQQVAERPVTQRMFDTLEAQREYNKRKFHARLYETR